MDYLTQRFSTISRMPFSEFVVKVASRCNLNCSYCYMYNMADKSYLVQPKFMSEEIQNAFTERLLRHAVQHGLRQVFVIFHGGEPLLFGKERLRQFSCHLSETLNRRGIDVSFGMQSNGTLIDEEWVDLLAEQHISIGISLDGPERFHDAHRIDHSGRGSFADVMRGIQILKNHRRGRDVFAGILTVVNPAITPREFYSFAVGMNPPAINVRLPLANYTFPPTPAPLSYGDWLKEVFDLWFEDDRPEIRVEPFASVLRLFFGDACGGEGLGTEPNGLIVIETNGDIEPSDNLKPCGHNFTKTGLNVIWNDLDEALEIPLIDLARKTDGYLCSTCKACEFVRVCGGGHAVERFNIVNGFDNPSIYCEDYKNFFAHVRHRINESIPTQLIKRFEDVETTYHKS